MNQNCLMYQRYLMYQKNLLLQTVQMNPSYRRNQMYQCYLMYQKNLWFPKFHSILKNLLY
jgi:hypothetical protein